MIAVFAMLIGFGAKSGHVSAPRMASGGASGSPLGIGSAFPHHRKSRCAGSYPCGLLCCRRGFPAGNLGAGCVDGVDAADSLYGLAACVSGNRYLRNGWLILRSARFRTFYLVCRCLRLSL